MTISYTNLLTRLNLKFKNPELENNYHVSMQPFNHVNFTSFLVLLMAGQIGFLVIKVLDKDLSFAILIGITIFINLFLFKNRKKLYKALEVIVLIFMSFLYTLGTLDLKLRLEKNERAQSGLFIFFEGYMLALVHQLFLRYFVQYSYVVLFDIGALLLRCFIFGPLMLEEEFPYPVLIHIFFDIAILHVTYRKEVTDRGLFEQLHKQKQELAMFKTLMIDSMPENIIIMNSSLTEELYINKAFRKAFRAFNNQADFQRDLSKIYVMKESLEASNPVSWVDTYFNKTTSLCLFDFIQEGMKHNIFDKDVFILQATLTPPDANKIPMAPLGRRTFEIKVFRISWDGADALSVILNDVTHREMIVSLKVSDMNKDKVLSSVTHELKTPLNGIQGMIQIMQQKTQNHEMLFHLNVCKSSADLLLHYINSIMDLQMLRKGKLKLRVTQVNIRELINEIEDLFFFQCQQKSLELITEVDKAVPETFYTDRNRLTEVLVHLVSNAVKFTYKGRVMLTLQIDSKNLNFINFCVIDTGIGMSEGDRVRLFKMYGRLDSNSVGTRGVGLGLTTSNGLVLKLSEDKREIGIGVESELSRGSKFSFSLPLDLLERIEKNLQKKGFRGSEPDDEDKFNLVINKTDEAKTTEGEAFLKFNKVDYQKDLYDEIKVDEDDFEELGDLGDVGEELIFDRDLKQFLNNNGLSIVQEKIKRYKTKTIENLYKWSESECGKISLPEETPFSQRELIKTPMMGLAMDNTPLNSGKLPRKNTGIFIHATKERTNDFDDTSGFTRPMNSGFSDIMDQSLKPIMQLSSSNLPNKKLLKTLSLNNKIKKYEETQQNRAHTYHPDSSKKDKKKILLVDDTAYNLLVAQKLIETQGYAVETALNGQLAIDKVKETYQQDKTMFDLILMDLQMPVMDGFQATKILIDMMNKKEIPVIPIVALTANDHEDISEQCKEIGMKSLIAKPLNANHLENLLKSLTSRGSV